MQTLECTKCETEKAVFLFSPSQREEKSPVCIKCNGIRRRERNGTASKRTPRGAAWRHSFNQFFIKTTD